MINLRNFNPMPFTVRGMLTHAAQLYQRKVPYIWGGKNPDAHPESPFPTRGLDCSGFVTYLWWMMSGGKIDVRDTHNAARLCDELDDCGRPENVIPGDLVLYGTGHASHVMVHLAAGLVVGQAWGGPENTTPEFSLSKGCVTLLMPVTYRNDVFACRRPRYARS